MGLDGISDMHGNVGEVSGLEFGVYMHETGLGIAGVILVMRDQCESCYMRLRECCASHDIHGISPAASPARSDRWNRLCPKTYAMNLCLRRRERRII